MNNKLSSTKNTNAIFLATVLVLGTIAQGAEDSSSALAKTEKLKKQWMELTL